MQRYFREVAEQQFTNDCMLPDDAGTIHIPTDSFNRIFQMSHVMKHIFHEGIGIRQLMDYYYLLQRGFSEEERNHDARLLKRFGMMKFARGLMYVLQELFQLEDRYLLVEPNKKIGLFILNEVMEGGNFGHYDQRFSFRGKGRMGFAITEVRRMMHLAWLFPAEAFSRPLFLLYHQVWKRVYK